MKQIIKQKKLTKNEENPSWTCLFKPHFSVDSSYPKILFRVTNPSLLYSTVCLSKTKINFSYKKFRVELLRMGMMIDEWRNKPKNADFLAFYYTFFHFFSLLCRIFFFSFVQMQIWAFFIVCLWRHFELQISIWMAPIVKKIANFRLPTWNNNNIYNLGILDVLDVF